MSISPNITRRNVLSTTAAAPVALAVPALARANSAPQPALTPGYVRKIGEVEVTTILDGWFPLELQVFNSIEEETLSAALRGAYLDPASAIPTGIAAYLVRAGDRTVLIDAGAADAFGPTAGRLGAALAGAGVDAAGVDDVVLTHMHPDHIAGLLGEDGAVFGHANLHVADADLAFWTSEQNRAAAPEGFRGFFDLAHGVRDAYSNRLSPFSGESDLGGGVSTTPMPGHTPGHSGVRIASGNDQLLIWGDMTAVAAVQFAHPDTGLVFDIDSALAAETRRRVLDMAAADRLLVAGTHLPFPGFGHVESKDGAYAWAPEGWRYS